MTEYESASFYFNSNMASKLLDSEIIFENYKIKECLGDLYDKYEKFKLVLVSCTSINTTKETNPLVSVRIEGLNWIGCYNYSTNDDSSAVVGNIQVASSTSNQFLNYPNQANWGCVFNKPSNTTVNLVISLFDEKLNKPITILRNITIQFTFVIYPVIE